MPDVVHERREDEREHLDRRGGGAPDRRVAREPVGAVGDARAVRGVVVRHELVRGLELGEEAAQRLRRDAELLAQALALEERPAERRERVPG